MAGGLLVVCVLEWLLVWVTFSQHVSGTVLELRDANFQNTVDGADLAVVVFHAPWCHHCHTYLSDVFEPAAAQLESEGITMATLDIEAAKEVQTKYVIQQVPSLKLFRHGIVFPYEGPAQTTGVPGLVEYLKEEKAKQNLEENPVITLTNDNFDDIVNSLELILVEFYTDMCVPCQRLEPHFTAAARQLLKNKPPIRLGRVQIPDQMEVAKRFPLEGYPLLIMFRYGTPYNYTGSKETEGIVEYMKQQAGPSSILFTRSEEVKKFINTREISVVAYFHDNPDSDLLGEFMESGNLVRTDMRLGHTLTEGVALHMKQTPGTIVVYHPIHLVSHYESGYSVIFSPPANATKLRELYLEHARPLVGQMTQANYKTVYSHRPLVLAYYDVDWSMDGFKATQYWHNLLASVAHQFHDSGIHFAIANEEDYPDDLRSLGLSDWGEDVAVGLFAPGPTKYPMTEELTSDSLADFLQSFLDDELRPHFSSEPPPKPVKGALIRKVVGSTFQAEVGNVKKNVMVLLCIPSLPDCQEAADFYPKLATQFKGVKDLVFTEMNVALNDPPVGTSVDSLPVFLFSPRGSEEILPVTPQPKDEADLAFFLKWKQNIKPLVKKGGKGKTKTKEEL